MRGQTKPGARRADERQPALGNKHFKKGRKEQRDRGTLDYKEHYRLYRGPRVTAKFPAAGR